MYSEHWKKTNGAVNRTINLYTLEMASDGIQLRYDALISDGDEA